MMFVCTRFGSREEFGSPVTSGAAVLFVGRRMLVRSVHLKAFRNHSDSILHLGSGLTLLVGDNGQGKTNVIEALAYLSLSKSFYAANDSQVVMLGESTLEVSATIADDGGRVSNVRICVDAASGKKTVAVNGGELDRISELVGMFPSVILSPEQYGIVAGGPAERRKFLDIVLCQVSPAYLADVVEYRRVLRQRNKLLLDARLNGTIPGGALQPWTEELIRLGSRVMHKRATLVDEMRETVEASYRHLAGSPVAVALRYVAGEDIQDQSTVEAIAAALGVSLEARAADERRRGVSLVGPHRDDLEFTVNGLAAERYASQGEQKTLLIALKLAENEFIAARCGETPILLLDDIFAELDRHRASRVLERLQACGQCIITTTDDSLTGETIPLTTARRIIVENGTCREAAP
jgi:DNA replication and repair protein RecF